ncbi:hypothetical protein DPMN_161269 [Dreissena polymorpha]|uniref:Uncharacterized protein n=1 Tax=Dreissena polymorpha TaxID=45954 RepID=A0A9D4ESU2_DREPO|nr:hypothetical protein DPMN_161269 [Dreissena polymorpha]
MPILREMSQSMAYLRVQGETVSNAHVEGDVPVLVATARKHPRVKIWGTSEIPENNINLKLD